MFLGVSPEVALWFALSVAVLQNVRLVHVAEEGFVHVAHLGTR